MWFAKVVKNMKWWDISLIKLGMLFFAFFVASYISAEILIGGRWIWLILAVIFSIRPASIAIKHMQSNNVNGGENGKKNKKKRK